MDNTINNNIINNNRNNKIPVFSKIVTMLFVLIIFFSSGIIFEKWGGFTRLAPIIINFLRDKIFGDKFVLNTEKNFFLFNDILRQKFKQNKKEEELIVEKIDYTLNFKSKELTEYYINNSNKFSDIDYNALFQLVNNFSPNITPLYKKTLKNEGIWEKINISPETFKPLYAKTFIRSDPERDYSIVYIYKFDLDRLSLEFIPGKDDNTSDPVCDGRMNKNQMEKVLWAFSGGFQYKHGNYGMKYKGKIILPPTNGAATLLYYKDGTLKLEEWSKEFLYDDNILWFRQNEPMMIKDGKISPIIDNRFWGYTPANKDPVYTVRTGLGFTKNNELVFAFGDSLSAKTLAIGMISAGVVTGMHLDMNYYNTHLVNFTKTMTGKLKTFNENKVLSYYNNIYANGFHRDYFIITSKENFLTSSNKQALK